MTSQNCTWTPLHTVGVPLAFPRHSLDVQCVPLYCRSTQGCPPKRPGQIGLGTCGDCCVQHTAGPKFLFVRCLSTEPGLQPRMRQQAVTVVSTGARQTGMIVRKAVGQRDTRPALKHRQTHKSDRKSLQCPRTATRSIPNVSPVLYIQVGISWTQDHWSFLNGTPQRPGHSLEHYTCSGRTNATAKLATLI